jgi:gluconolactonase
MIFAGDLKNPEGPVLLPDGNWALVEMHPERGWVLWLSADGRSRRVIARTGRPNGLTLDRNGVLWVAESMNPPSLLRMTLDGRHEVFATGDGTTPFLFPNDLVFGRDGLLYMTDSGIRITEWRSLAPEERERRRIDGRVFRIDVKTRRVDRIDSGLNFANGIVFGPNDDLFVATTQDGKVWRYPKQGAGFGPRQLFADVRDPTKTGGFRGPDGMKFGLDGNLYVAAVNQGDVTVVAPDGHVIRRIQLNGPAPTNVCFGPKDSGKLYVTEQGVGNFEVYDVATDGLPLHG